MPESSLHIIYYLPTSLGQAFRLPRKTFLWKGIHKIRICYPNRLLNDEIMLIFMKETKKKQRHQEKNNNNELGIQDKEDEILVYLECTLHAWLYITYLFLYRFFFIDFLHVSLCSTFIWRCTVCRNLINFPGRHKINQAFTYDFDKFS